MNRKTGAIVSYVLLLFEIAFALFFTPYIIRTLGGVEYGVYKLTESISSYLLLLDMGVGQAVVRWITKYRVRGEKTQEAQFLGITTIFYIAIGIFTFLIGQILITLTPDFFAVGLSTNEVILTQKLLGVMVINIAVTLGTVGYVNTITAYEHFFFSKGILIVQIVLRFIFYYIALRMHLGSYGMAVTQTVLTVATKMFCVLYVLLILKITPIFCGFEKKVVMEIVKYSFLIFLLMISTQINSTLDNIILASAVPSSSSMLAIYSVALQLTYYYNSVGDGITGLLLPGVVRLIETGAGAAKLTDEMIRIGRYVLLFSALVWIEFFVCGKNFVLLWVGEDYIEAYYIALPLMSIYLIMQVQSIGDNMLNAKNEIKELTFTRVGIIFVNIAISLILIRWNPMIGTMIGTLISLIMGGVLIKNYLFIKHLDINLPRYFGSVTEGIMPCVFGVLVFGMFTRPFFTKKWSHFFLQGMLVAVLYLTVMWLFGLAKSEKENLNYMMSYVLRGIKKSQWTSKKK